MMLERENGMALEWAQATDLPAVLTLLEACALPTEGVDAVLSTLLVAREGEDLIGCAALEVYGTVALLRSVAVHPAHRGRMLGQRLVQAILEHAEHLGIRDVYLLTETARGFFPRFGFHPIERAAVSPAIHASQEWMSLCPVSAQAMVTTLSPGTGGEQCV